MTDQPPEEPEAPPRRRHRKASAKEPGRTVVVSHEIRNPLGVITALSELLLSRDLPLAERHIVELIRLAGHHLSAVTEDLVAEASLGVDRFRVLPAAFAPAETLRAIAALYAPLTAGTAKTIEVKIDADAPQMIVSDEARIRQILFNLVSNAAKCMTRGHIVLRLSAGDGAVRFEVQDDGPGIEEGFVPRPFDEASDPTAPGSGLGLWISERIAGAIAGTLSLAPRPEGGTLATLTVPAEIAATVPAEPTPARPRRRRGDAAAPMSEAGVPDRRAGSGKRRRQKADAGKGRSAGPRGVERALVVDDSPVSRMLLETILSSFGIAVETAANGHDALATLHVFKPDIILMDWSLPEETGADAVARIAAGCDRLPPVIGLSASERPADADCFSGWLVKPFTPRELYREIERAVFGDTAAEHAGA